MKRLEKYRITSIRGGAPERLQLHLESRLVAEIRVADGIARLVLPVLDDPDVHACMWFASVLGEDELADVERDHVLHVAIERLDGFVDPRSEHGKLDAHEPIPPPSCCLSRPTMRPFRRPDGLPTRLLRVVSASPCAYCAR